MKSHFSLLSGVLSLSATCLAASSSGVPTQYSCHLKPYNGTETALNCGTVQIGGIQAGLYSYANFPGCRFAVEVMTSDVYGSTGVFFNLLNNASDGVSLGEAVTFDSSQYALRSYFSEQPGNSNSTLLELDCTPVR